MDGMVPSFIIVWFGAAVVFVIVGLANLGRGVSSRHDTTDLREIGRTTDATVIANHEQTHTGRDNDGRKQITHSYRPQLSYRGPDGKAVTAVGPVATPEPIPVGTVVPLRYHPEEPTRVEIVSGPGRSEEAARATLGCGCVILIVLGLALAVSGYYLLSMMK
jgi:hypothetical protein